MIPQTPQLGGWLISTAVATVTPEHYMEILVGDTLYFSANDGSSGYELWAHDTSNASTWRVADINSGSGHSYPGLTWTRYSSVIRSTSVRMMEAAATNCGLMIPQTPQLGRWLISTAELAPVTPDITAWRY